MRKIIILIGLMFVCSVSNATVPVANYFSKTPVQVCQPSDSNSNCGGGSGGGNVGIGTTNRVVFQIGSTTTGTPYNINADSNGNLGIGTNLPSTLLEVGTQRFNVLVGGNVGVGIIAPTSKLHIEGPTGAGANSLFKLSKAGGYGETNLSQYYNSVSDYGLNINSGQLLLNASNGNFGVGDSTPNRILVVRELDATSAPTTGQKAVIRVTNGSTTVGTGAGIQFSHDDDADAQTTAMISEVLTSTSNQWAGDLTFSTKVDANATTLNEYMRIKSGGNIGIGTTTPGGALTVMNGNVGIGTWKPEGKLVIMNGNVGIGVLNPSSPFHVSTNITAGNIISADRFRSGTGDATGPGFSFTGSTGTGMWSPGTNSMALSSAGVERLRIDSGGNVGIGSTNPGTKIDVQGTIRTTAFQLSTNPGDNLVLMSNAVGIGTWSTIPAVGGVGASSQWLNEAGNVGLNTTGRIGLGTVTTTARLTILGNIGVGTTAGDKFLTTAPPVGGALIYGNVGIGTAIPNTIVSISGIDNNGIDINTDTSSITSLTATYLIVAGGGGGGSQFAGGGGAGEYKTATYSITPGSSYSVTVGTGGAGSVGSGAAAAKGTDSSAFSITSAGGGNGGSQAAVGGNGGSGGGGAGGDVLAKAGGTAQSGGNVGGDSNTNGDANTAAGGGGGGAGAVGQASPGLNIAGDGGTGLNNSISGSSVMYACGGGGAGGTTYASGGAAGCSCAGAGGGNTTGNPATGAKGCGGGGGGYNVPTGAAGGDGGGGTVIISYVSTYGDGTGGTITYSGGNTIHTFTTSGTFIAPTINNTGIPRIKFSNSGTTKFTIGADGADSHQFKIGTTSVSANTRLTIDSSGNIGIGTTIPKGGLSVMNGNVGIGTWIVDGGGLVVANGMANVGIGTVRPGTKLDVNGTTRMTGFQLPTNAASNLVLMSNAVGIGTWSTIPAGGGSSTWTETELDFGSTPIFDKTFTVTDAGVSGTSKIALVPSGGTGTDRVGNDMEWDNILLSARAGTGEFTVSALAFPGPIVGKRKINYQVY